MNLSAHARAVRLEIVDERGQPIRAAMISIRCEDEWSGYVRPTESRTTLLLPRTPVEISITAEGYRRAETTAAVADQRIVLPDGIPVEVELAPTFPLESGWQLLARWRPAGEATPILREDSFGRDHIARVGLPDAGEWIVEVDLRVGDRQIRVMNRSLAIADERQPQRFSLQIEPDERDQALAELRR